MKNYVECAFVNGFPIKYGKILGYLVQEDMDGLCLSVIRETFYEHPDCKEFMLSVKEMETVTRARKGENNYSALYLLMMAQDNVGGICKKE
jgi:hypothetical protein